MNCTKNLYIFSNLCTEDTFKYILAENTNYHYPAGKGAAPSQSHQKTEAKQVAPDLKKQTDDVVSMERSKTSDVTVIVRIRPLSASEQEACNAKIDWKALLQSGKTLLLQNNNPYSATSLKKPPSKPFTFDGVMHEACTTVQVFQQTGARAVSEVVCGVSAVVIAYGPTGSGKTYSLLGEGKTSKDSSSVQGIMSMTFQDLLQKLKERADKENGQKENLVSYVVEVSAVQVYLNQVRDLLTTDRQILRVLAQNNEPTPSNVGGQIFYLKPQEKFTPCKDATDFERVLQKVVSARVQSSTLMNANSSRSHLIITLAVRKNVKNVKIGEDGSRVYMSTLTLVDLAGNERDSARQQNTDFGGQ
jgi:hypothetical protein